MEPIKVGLLGLGTVGSGTVNVLLRNAEEISRRAGRNIQICSIATRNPKKQRQCDLTGINLTADPYKIVTDPQIDVVLELIGGIDTAYQLILQAIAHKKHVVTANKALIAHYGNEIFTAAQKAGVMVAFEAAVGGGIPIIKALREGLAGNRIEWLAGIINGTNNFILTEMRDKGCSFTQALEDAQKKGYAELDPSFDIGGIDAAHKLTILASLAFGIPLQFQKTYIEGIEKIAQEDINYAYRLGYRIKHIGIARRRSAGIELRVHPTLIPDRRLIANVDGVMNAVLVKGDAVGSTLYYGPGAGSEPTASAVIADLIDVVRTLTSDPENRVPHLAFQPNLLVNTPILSIIEAKTAYYLRMQALDRPGVLADITRVFGENNISIESILQQEPISGEQDVPIIILTQRVLEQNMDKAICQIEQLSSIKGKIKKIRLEAFR
ncbi:homoserine dehydrogenase [Candidatus Nitrosacidococcus tergens]|uniref:Homoserine dehydrogenase n=1 Tax=Candidatus Nitrosacidococcus tergens TaxID=553981 RepID=A0A7G1QAI7_9GAMM|nr:homoserine dehydrogenase [Candidatus Nitrosacidococcus tergens]CAB1276582.1 Homoserine dehydrogenase [Candidatus Nitrosacidococcus tergens]